MAAKSLEAKILGVMAAVDGVEKAGTNQAQNYKFVRATDVARAIRKACIAEGVAVSVSTDAVSIQPPFKEGGTQQLTRATGTLTFMDTDTERVISVNWEGHGQDAGDKGLAKALTAGVKGALRAFFLIPDDSDPENDGGERVVGQSQQAASRDPEAKATTAQQKMIFAKADGASLSKEQTQYLFKVVTGKESGKLLTNKDIDSLVEAFSSPAIMAAVQVFGVEQPVQQELVTA